MVCCSLALVIYGLVSVLVVVKVVLLVALVFVVISLLRSCIKYELSLSPIGIETTNCFHVCLNIIVLFMLTLYSTGDKNIYLKWSFRLTFPIAHSVYYLGFSPYHVVVWAGIFPCTKSPFCQTSTAYFLFNYLSPPLLPMLVFSNDAVGIQYSTL